ncbi:lysosome-associated membrane glycoprotein 3 [Conger conger]|uniref:lysosome-associated membrane glycoprotein 3 n=1 Tax=Conger conger TaxID=82655 RepID=UPI002A59DD0E|nr:lysosome-associated membrane glycoprotein 3 [Conger conger]
MQQPCGAGRRLQMKDALVTLQQNVGALLICVLLWTGTSVAMETQQGTDLPSARKQEITPPSSGTPLYDPKHSAPLLVPHPKQPPTACYDIMDSSESECMKTQMGVQYMVTVNKSMLYFNIHPSSTRVTGVCGQTTSILALNFTGGHLEFTFRKEDNTSYVTSVKAGLEGSVCKGCEHLLFKGVKTNMKLFEAHAGFCYKCDTQTTLPLAANLSVKIIHAQIQALGITDNKFGLEEECWPDYYRRVMPVVLGGVAIGVCLVAFLTYLLIRERRPHGYQRI